MVTPPPTAVMTKAEDPEDPEEAAATVSVAVPVPGAARLEAERLAVTPGKVPLTESARAELKPLPAAVFKVTAAVPPGTREICGVFPVSLKVGPVSVRVTVAVLVWVPLAAEICKGKAPWVSAAVASMARVKLPDPGAAKLEVESVAVTPEGAPVTERATAALKLLMSETAPLTLALVPRVAVAVAGAVT